MSNSFFARVNWTLVGAVLALAAAGANFALHSHEGGSVPAQFADSSAKPVPDFQFADQDGKTLTLADFRGQVVVLDVWATWCGPCRAEFPRLDRLQAAMGGKGVTVIALSVDSKGRAAVDRFYDETGVKSLGKFTDPSGNSSRALGVRGLPTALVLDRQGHEVARIEGEADWDGAAMMGKLRDLAGAG